ncbi:MULTISPECIES: hypothetical protein [Micromonospora]|nr:MULTISPECIES: hypothetical protein [Micromonospora]NES15209.1 hypothetical protein [Micromonospora sp. PPF5-17B]NES38125.1 hypothetical protein [Micromonospora solifontis]NES56544.1 hypothetical protein [Micromonospora sp. PPF5-6]
MASYRLLAVASLTALVTTLSGAASAAPPTVDRAAAKASVTTVRGPQQAVRLATGERLELMRADTRSVSPFRVLPAGNSVRPGRFAYGAAGGKLRVQPTGHRAQAVRVRAGARGSATVTAGAYPVTLTIASPTAVAFKLLYVWDRQTWTSYSVKDEEFTPNGSVQLPDGNYFAVALYSQSGGGSYLLTRTFQVAGAGATVRFDESTAKETRIAVDDPTATRYTSAVWISVPGGLAGFAGGGAEKTYVTPFSVPGASLRLHELLVKRGTSEYVPGPYRYDLYRSFDGTVPATPVANVTRAGLAVTTTAVRGQARATNGTLQTVPYTAGDWTGVYLPSPVAVPGTLTEYVTPSQSFGRLLNYRPTAQDMTLTERVLPAGLSAGETIGGAPFAPRRAPGSDSYRDITRMWIYEYPALSDAAGNLGLDRDAKVSINLSSGGEPYISASGLSPYQSVSATVPSVSTVYQLNHTVTRVASWSRLSTEVRSEWRFLSAGVRYSDPLPLVDIGFTTTGLDTQNTAPLAPMRINATATSRRPGAATTLTGLEYSTDDGATWATLPVSGSADRASVELTVPSTAAFVSLRATAADDSGDTLRRTVIRAFAGPASQADETVGATRVSNVVVNGGRPVVLTPSGVAEFTATFTATDPAGIAAGDVYLRRGPSRGYLPRGSSAGPDSVLVSGAATVCTPTSTTTATCQATFRVDPRLSLGRNNLAGAWQVAVRATSNDGRSFTDRRAAATFPLLRQTTLTTTATPTSVTAGKTISVQGTLSQANWERMPYSGYPGQAVTLQFKKAGGSTYANVKSVTVDQVGEVTVKVTASVSGYWRYVFAGSPTAAAVTSGSVYVKVT